jgi:hypothetical protein
MPAGRAPPWRRGVGGGGARVAEALGVHDSSAPRRATPAPPGGDPCPPPFRKARSVPDAPPLGLHSERHLQIPAGPRHGAARVQRQAQAAQPGVKSAQRRAKERRAVHLALLDAGQLDRKGVQGGVLGRADLLRGEGQGQEDGVQGVRSVGMEESRGVRLKAHSAVC